MRAPDVMQEGLFSFKRLEEFVPPDHPLRGIRAILNAALARLDAKFDDMYSPIGRDSALVHFEIEKWLMVRCGFDFYWAHSMPNKHNDDRRHHIPKMSFKV